MTQKGETHIKLWIKVTLHAYVCWRVFHSEIVFRCYLFVRRSCHASYKKEKRLPRVQYIRRGYRHIESAVYCSAILLLALLGMQRLSCKYGMNEFRKVILNAIRYLNGFAPLTPERTDMLSGRTCRIVELHHEPWVKKGTCLQNDKYLHGECDNICNARTVCTVTIILVSLDTAAQRRTATVVSPTIKPQKCVC